MSTSHYAGSQLAGGVFIFFCVIRRHFRWVRAVSGGNVFFAKYRGPFGGSQMSGGGIIILRVIRRHFLACGRGPSCQPLHVQSTSDACRSLTMLTRPCREHQGGGRRQGLGRERHGAREDSAGVSNVEGSTRIYWFICRRRRAWPAVGIVGAVRPPRQHSRPREAGACGTTGGWSKKTRG